MPIARCAVLTGLRKIEILERPVGPPAAGQVQLSIGAVGICGSDLAYFAHGVAGGFKKIDFSPTGLCTGYCGQMGHECAGTVLACGDGVADLKPGDRVALEAGVPCAVCMHCRTGRYNLCSSMRFIGSAVNETAGAMVTVFNHPAGHCHKLPSHVTLDEGAMLEPLCVALQARSRRDTSRNTRQDGRRDAPSGAPPSRAGGTPRARLRGHARAHHRSRPDWSAVCARGEVSRSDDGGDERLG